MRHGTRNLGNSAVPRLRCPLTKGKMKFQKNINTKNRNMMTAKHQAQKTNKQKEHEDKSKRFSNSKKVGMRIRLEEKKKRIEKEMSVEERGERKLRRSGIYPHKRSNLSFSLSPPPFLSLCATLRLIAKFCLRKEPIH